MLHFLKNSSYNFQFDSRKCNENSIFVALEIGNRSGMEFIPDALKNGAKIVISQAPVVGMNIVKPENLTELTTNLNIVTPDSLQFLQDIAKEKFLYLKKSGIKTIGITGSVGKTTTKELIKNTLEQYGRVYATEGNYNNHIGVPLTILNSPWNIDFLVLEMGMNHYGEIAELVNIAPCEFSIITNAKESHAGNFHNGTQGVMQAKFEILESNGKCFISDELFERFKSDGVLLQKYGIHQIISVDNSIKIVHKNGESLFTFDGRAFKLEGFYSQEQCKMFAVTITMMDIIVGEKISKILLPQLKGRGNIIKWQGINVVNDSYNASLTSILNAFENFINLNGKKLCILGEIRELGTLAREYHEKIMPHLENFDDIILIGKEFGATNKKYRYFETYEELLNFLQTNQEFVQSFENILVKSSNGVMLWKLFEDFFV